MEFEKKVAKTVARLKLQELVIEQRHIYQQLAWIRACERVGRNSDECQILRVICEDGLKLNEKLIDSYYKLAYKQ